MLPTDAAMQHGSMVNAVQNVSQKMVRAGVLMKAFSFHEASSFLISLHEEGVFTTECNHEFLVYEKEVKCSKCYEVFKRAN